MVLRIQNAWSNSDIYGHRDFTQIKETFCPPFPFCHVKNLTNFNVLSIGHLMGHLKSISSLKYFKAILSPFNQQVTDNASFNRHSDTSANEISADSGDFSSFVSPIWQNFKTSHYENKLHLMGFMNFQPLYHKTLKQILHLLVNIFFFSFYLLVKRLLHVQIFATYIT